MLRAGFTKRNVSAIALLLMGLSCSASSNGGKSSPEHGGSSNGGQPTTSGGTQAAGGTDNAALGGRLGQGGFVASGGAQQQNSAVPPRRMKFDFNVETAERYFYKSDPFLSAFWLTMSTLFPAGETFFIDSVRHYRDRIKDPALQEEIAGRDVFG